MPDDPNYSNGPFSVVGAQGCRQAGWPFTVISYPASQNQVVVLG
ncbi:hypothetical protein HK44_015200 [Pseudomonas fluorescens HK44]|uniref:Uncharacterized protein n=1 Tax=Pseudomonas fluorescens HK44 TaxID=1042209 RepID=A0A010SM34_PSEFL|nr:hypothetical protein [Pseudomonas fluorescens]EXF92243.1 hypothetical protein HK44_015200 [Pseudomonas fluorescens HK44]